jgi:glycosyltransferase involved in cell wall biosynthesis
MKLTIDLRMLNASGIGTYLKNIIPGILHSFEHVSVLGNYDEISQFEWSKQVTIIAFNEGIYSVKAQLKYPLVVPECDILWCPHFNAPLLPVKAKKIVVTIHDVYHLSKSNKLPLLQKMYARLLYKNAAGKAAAVFTVSQFSKQELIQYTGAPANKITVVYCGVDTRFFNPGIAQETALSLPENYILYVGNVKPHKNLITLLKAYNELEQGLRDSYKLVIIGKETGFINEDTSLAQFIGDNNLTDRILFTGYVEDKEIPVIYKKAALFVFPSLYEGFGLPVLESLAVHTPVISSNAASLPEVGGKAVHYFNPLDFKELSKKIKEVLGQPQNTGFIEEADRQVALFSWENSVQKHLEIFKNI